MQVSRSSAREVFVLSWLINKKCVDVSFGVWFCCFIIFNLLFMCKINNLQPELYHPSGTRYELHISHSTESHTDTLTFSAKQRGGALQEFSDLLQRSFLSAADAALGVLTTRWGGDLITDDSEPRLVSHKHIKTHHWWGWLSRLNKRSEALIMKWNWSSWRLVSICNHEHNSGLLKRRDL